MVTLGETALFNGTETGETLTAIIDIGSTFTRVPQSIFDNLTSLLGDKVECSTEVCFYRGECDHHIEDQL